MKETGVPRQNGFTEVSMVMLTGRFGKTIMLTVFDKAGLPVLQRALDVSRQDTTSPCWGTYVYVDEFDPTFVQLTFH